MSGERSVDALVDRLVMGHACDPPQWSHKSFAGDWWEECDCGADREAYSSSRDACALAEARMIERGLGREYWAALDLAVRAANPTTLRDSWEHELQLLTADPLTRCQAMLQALAEAEG